MRRFLSIGVVVPVLAGACFADQDSARKPDPPVAASSSVSAPGGDRLTPSELEELLGPIALYPDALLANVLAASVYPQEVAEAAAAVKGGATAAQIDAKPWEPPVKAVAKVPDALKMLGEYPDWTTALGQAYLIQAKDVMDTVQTLRKKATDNGALQSTPEQTVKAEPDVIYIESSDPEVIYVPSYEPSVVYVDDDDDEWAAGVIGFGLGVTTGLLLSDLDCDWHGGCVGWGGGYHNDIDIDTGDINIGNDVNIGNGNRARPGQEGNAWRPNQNKATAATRPSQAQGWRNTAAGQGQGRFPASTTSNWSQGLGTRRPTAGTRPTQTPGAGGAAQQRQAAQQRPAAQQKPANASRVPASRPPSAVPSNRGGAGAGSGAGASRPSTGGGASRPSGGRTAGGGGGGNRSGSAYSGGGGTRAASQRGASSRGGGGGGRSGGGGRGGGGRR